VSALPEPFAEIFRSLTRIKDAGDRIASAQHLIADEMRHLIPILAQLIPPVTQPVPRAVDSPEAKP
jgi:hypothetical protein